MQGPPAQPSAPRRVPTKPPRKPLLQPRRGGPGSCLPIREMSGLGVPALPPSLPRGPRLDLLWEWRAGRPRSQLSTVRLARVLTSVPCCLAGDLPLHVTSEVPAQPGNLTLLSCGVRASLLSGVRETGWRGSPIWSPCGAFPRGVHAGLRSQGEDRLLLALEESDLVPIWKYCYWRVGREDSWPCTVAWGRGGPFSSGHLRM